MAATAAGATNARATPRPPLADVRVLDLTQFLAGPFCTMILGDMGADVIKIEPPGGEPQRNAMKVNADDADPPSFLALNRNKRSVALDLRSDAGRELLCDMVAQADVLVENFKPGTTSKLGIDYDRLSALRPELIYASITGFGDTGPYASRPGLDLITQGMSGIMSVTGTRGGELVKCGVAVTDLTSGMFGAIGILNAYIARLTTGEGQYVTSSLFEAGVALAIHESAELWSRGTTPGPLGSGHRFAAPYQALRAQDGYLTVGAGTDKLWGRFCQAIEREDLTDDERFATNNQRMENLEVLEEELERTLQTAPAAEWVDKIIAAGVPAGPILDYRQVLEDPHTLARGMVTEIDHPRAGRVKSLGSPIKLSKAPEHDPRPAPLLGQHTDEALTQLGIDEARIANLRERGVVG
jgi:crotonobetainyl-CoA:carnitine CoA-transferase CaiB-like acyl-CoA transferase